MDENSEERYLTEDEALALATNLLRTFAADNWELDSTKLLYAARVLDKHREGTL